ncbi:hypothetical protein BJ508DRAFT_414831 [Ascobolus immersus RN42]|uniref:Uncharacterized protein n=1 Tax=Ascobolus immersus RN42 TaxID=1160509 RepID=A0A3N4I7G3_ASCIM|nr:hypothetical protein BJ508DRAFT_414831 [Ascobolus immersus RN42]
MQSPETEPDSSEAPVLAIIGRNRASERQSTEIQQNPSEAIEPMQKRAWPDEDDRDVNLWLPFLPAPPEEKLWELHARHRLKRDKNAYSHMDLIYDQLLEIFRPLQTDYDADFRKLLYEPAQQFIFPVVAREAFKQRCTHPNKWTESTKGFTSEDFPLDLVYMVFEERHKAGLLRDGQVRLVCAVLQSARDQLDAIVSKDFIGLDIRLIYRMAENALTEFFCSASFRSERLENLILKYLAEEDVNMEVVRGVTLRTASLWRHYSNLEILYASALDLGSKDERLAAYESSLLVMQKLESQ